MERTMNKFSQHFEELEKHLGNTMNSSIGLAEDLLESGEKYQSQISEVEGCLLDLATLHNEVEILKECVAHTDQVQSRQTEYQDPEDLYETFTSKLADVRGSGATDFNPKDHPAYTEFVQCLQEDDECEDGAQLQSINSDDDIVVNKVQQSLYCPLTKKLLEAPVTSKVCHHSYSNKAIREHLRKRPNPKCPVCNEPMRENDLVKDKKLMRKVKKKRKEKESSFSASEGTVVKL